MIEATQLTKAALIVNEAQDKLKELLGVEVNILLNFNFNGVITIDDVMQIVSGLSGISVDIMKSKVQSQEVVYCRFVCFYIMKKYLNLSLKGIGGIFGKDHTTVLNGLNVIKNEPNNKELQNLLITCEQHFIKEVLHEN